MFLDLLGFEWQYHRQQLTFKLAVPIFFVMGLMLGFANFGALEAHANAPITITYALTILSLGAPILMALIAGGAILRDHEYRMEPIIFATSMTHFQFITSRFAGLILCGCIAVMPAFIGLALSHALPFQPADAIGDGRFGAYLWAMSTMVWPNVLFSGAIIFATASLTKSAPATYIGGIFLYILYFVGSMLGNSPLMASSSSLSLEQARSASILDPYGMVAIIEQTRFWTPLEKNSEFLVLEGPLLLNRLLVVGLSLCIFVCTYKLFKFRQPKAGKSKKQPSEPNDHAVVTPSFILCAKPTPNHFLSFISQTKLNLRTLLLGLPFFAFLLLWIFFIGMDLFERKDLLGQPIMPLTSILLEPVIEPLLKFGVLIMVFYAAELVWHHRRVGISTILDTYPCPNSVFWASHFTALAGMVLVFITITFSMILCFQFGNGSWEINWRFLVVIGLQTGASLVLASILATVIIRRIPSKYGGMAVSFLLIILFSGFILRRNPGLEHPMLRFGYTMPNIMSDMAGSGYHFLANLTFLGFWASIAGVLALVSLRFWKRGLDVTPRNTQKSIMLSGFVCCLAALGFGSILFYQLNIKHTYFHREAGLEWQQRYEERYAKLETLPQPTLMHVEATAHLEPSKRFLEFSGTLTFENQQDVPLTQAWVGTSNAIEIGHLIVQGAVLDTTDSTYNHYLFQFEQPLKPGDQFQLQFKGDVIRSSFSSMDRENYILPKASYVELEKLLPFFGFASNRTIHNPKTRKRRNMPPRNRFAAVTEAQNLPNDWASFSLTVSTQKDHTVIAPGDLTRTWTEKNRQYFTFSSPKPLPLGLGIASGVYEKKTTRLGNIQVEYYYSPSQPYHRDHILDMAAKTLQAGMETYGPYPFEQLKIAVIPSFSNAVGGTAYPGTVFLVEDRVILVKSPPDALDIVGRIVAHEVGHQWWGKQLNPAAVEGRGMLTEMMAVYTEFLVTEPENGMTDSLRYLDKCAELYFLLRSYERDHERSLHRVNFQPYVYYFKGAHVAYNLRQLLGAPLFHRFLKRFLETHSYPHHPVTDDFMTMLLEMAPESSHAKIRQLLQQVVIFNLQARTATLKPSPTGQYELILSLRATQTSTVNGSLPLDMPLDDYLEIGLYQGTELVEIKRVSLTQINQTISLQTEHRIDTVLLDPNRRFLELNTDDNSATCNL